MDSFIVKIARQISTLGRPFEVMVEKLKPWYIKFRDKYIEFKRMIFPEENPENLSKLFCVGDILEIGALSEPAKFERSSRVKYADVHSEEDLRKIISAIPISMLYAKPLVKLDFVLSGPKYELDMIPDETFDAVYSSHVMEHVPNFLHSLKEQIRVTRAGGSIYAIIPNKNFTYDRERFTTPVEKIIDRFNQQIFTFDFREALELVQKTVDHPLYVGKGADFAREILTTNTGMHHFHVFDHENVIEILRFAMKTFAVKVKYFSSRGENIHLCLEKLG
jgi:SAM-dependent methyltransferase